jgi:hypothetical protein
MSEPTNFDRARRAAYALESYVEAQGLEQEDPETNLRDFLTDLRHLCHIEEWDYDAADRMAYDHYGCEVADERDQRRKDASVSRDA